MAERLLERPTFILSSVRSGSTLLRALVNAHSQLCSPPELHLAAIRLAELRYGARRSMEAVGLSASDLENLLWDRVLHLHLERSGKRYVVDKTPQNVLVWRRIRACWPDARFVVLLRDPRDIAVSWYRAEQRSGFRDPDTWTLDEAVKDVVRYLEPLEEARHSLDALTVRYEELTGEPESTMRSVCAFLDVAWEPRMLHYGDGGPGSFLPGLGDWGARIESGRILPRRTHSWGESAPPESLRHYAALWGYA
ncbi:sulfotransferase family protein [Streptomyces sp. 4N509B]|uniref:sulfotransferase family protein n=1 Tax=Streptomyces sp. 4N509B TaxID=3457413 RepID=UPI003FD01761